MKLITTLLLLFGVAHFGYSQQYSHKVEIIISDQAAIRVKPNSVENTQFNFENITDLKEGIENTSAGVYQVRSNTKWVVTARAGQEYFQNSGEGSSEIMPSTVLKFKESANSSYLSLNSTDQILVTGNVGDFGGQNEFELDYKADPGLGFTPGTYSMDVYLTVSGE